MKRKKENRKEAPQSAPADLLTTMSGLSVPELAALNKSLPIMIQTKVESGLHSNNLADIMKSNLYLDEIKGQGKTKSIFFDPNDYSTSGQGFKSSSSQLPFSVMRRMGDLFIVRAIVNTRIEQVQNFLHFSEDEQKEGFTIRRKKGLFLNETSEELTKQEKVEAASIVDFLNKGGNTGKWDKHDNFQDFMRKILYDSLTLDQLAFEITRKPNNEIDRFQAIDASLIRFLDTVDPKFKSQFENLRWKGYLPRYCMVYAHQIIENPVTREPIVYFPWELGFGVRNQSTNIYRNGYGTSELEILNQIVLGIMWGFEYNANFFKNGSQPKGFLNIEDDNIDNKTLNEFRQEWSQMLTGVTNSHRTAVMQGLKLNWIDLQKGNRDMEFDNWIKLLIIVACSVYRIDPTELGYQFQDNNKMLGQEGQKERLAHSRTKGLKPLLTFSQEIINRYLVSELSPTLEFVFTGVEVEDEKAQVELDKTKLESGMVAFQDVFEKYSGRKYNEATDTILNQVFQTAAQRKEQSAMYGSQFMNEQADPNAAKEGEEGKNPFDAYKSVKAERDPFAELLDDYVGKLFNK